jgi:hypothetical protein
LCLVTRQERQVLARAVALQQDRQPCACVPVAHALDPTFLSACPLMTLEYKVAESSPTILGFVWRRVYVCRVSCVVCEGSSDEHSHHTPCAHACTHAHAHTPHRKALTKGAD